VSLVTAFPLATVGPNFYIGFSIEV